MHSAPVVYWLFAALACVVLLVLSGKMKTPLWMQIVAALVLGAVGGHLFPDDVDSTRWIGDAFIRLTRMLVAPLILTTLVSGVVSMDDPKRLGPLGLRAGAFYLFTTVLAVTIGLFSALLIQPGADIDAEWQSVALLQDAASHLGQASSAGPLGWMLSIIPINPIQALAETDILGLTFFSIIFGVGILLAGEAGRPIASVVDSASQVMIKITGLVMQASPYGVYALIAWVIGENGIDSLQYLTKLLMAVFIACVIHILIVYGTLVKALTRIPVKRFFAGIASAQSIAFSTASSSATLPVTIKCVTDNLGVDKSVAGAVLPIGATINMDGTCIYISVIALFAAQSLGISVSIADYVMIALTTTLASIGGAGVPSAALFVSTAVFTSLGMTMEQIVMVVALVLPFDRLFDMVRTMTNVTGDAVVAVIVAEADNGSTGEESRAVEGRWSMLKGERKTLGVRGRHVLYRNKA